jgi:hypothetical protein
VVQIKATEKGDLVRWVDLYTTFNSRVLDRISNRMAFTIAWCIAVTASIQVRALSLSLSLPLSLFSRSLSSLSSLSLSRARALGLGFEF